MRKVVFDIETKNLFEDVGSVDPTRLDISVVGVYDSFTDTYRCFVEEEFNELWPILERADILIGFNSDHFDTPLLNKYYSGDLTKIKSVDLLREIKRATGKRYSLGNIATATLGYGKSGRGIEATVWWKQGEIEKVKKYCLDDVRITKEIYDYAMKYGHLKFSDGPDTLTSHIDTSTWEKIEEKALTQSLF